MNARTPLRGRTLGGSHGEKLEEFKVGLRHVTRL